MKFLEFLDRIGQRRHDRAMVHPRRPLDIRSFIGLAFLVGYYLMVLRFINRVVPEANVPLVRDSMLVLGPAVGAIVQSLFRSDVRDELQTQNTGVAFGALRASADATKAATETLPAGTNAGIGQAADEVAGAARDRAEEIKGEN